MASSIHDEINAKHFCENDKRLQKLKKTRVHHNLRWEMGGSIFKTNMVFPIHLATLDSLWAISDVERTIGIP